MQGERKRDRVSVDVAAGLKGSETDAVASGIRILYEIIKTVEVSTPFSAIRQTYAAPWIRWLKLRRAGPGCQSAGQIACRHVPSGVGR